jgi:predicted  nucleic acid-binding Zn-ribbon protein|tara:strand:+ start:107 stop:502 length:396 start_codon:yes stop_codon:yes gene_type:complete
MILAPVSVGEIFDKLSILQIKEQKIADPIKLSNVKTEIKELNKSIIDLDINEKSSQDVLDALKTELYETNFKLWDIEDALRKLESQKKFEREFISLARQVYITNDKRAEIKKEINRLTDSDIVEEKHYSEY